MEPQNETVIFLVNTRAAQTSLSYAPPGLKVLVKNTFVSGIKEETFEVLKFEPITLVYQNKEVKLAPSYVPEAGTSLLG